MARSQDVVVADAMYTMLREMDRNAYVDELPKILAVKPGTAA